MTWFDAPPAADVMPWADATDARLLAMAAPADGTAPIWVQLVPFAMILGIFYFVILLPMRRRQKKVQVFQDALKVGDRVITTSGIYGTVTKVNDTSVQLQIAEKVRIEVAKASVGGYQGQEPVVQESSGL
jgi:preprotein translocase subunit YajC